MISAILGAPTSDPFSPSNATVKLAALKRLLLSCTLMFMVACGGGGRNAPTPTPPVAQPGFGHVVLLVEENHSFSQVIGNSSMPYLNGLASQYGLATQYYADVHPSIGNYFMLTTGRLETSDDSFPGTITDDNLVRRIVDAGKSWKAYADGLPMAGYTGGDVYPYLKRHNPFAYLSDVVGNQSQAANLVPFSQFASDVASGNVPNFSYIVPGALNDAHDGSLTQADDWLQQNLSPLLSSPLFQNDGLLIITFDEADGSDSTHGGGHVATIVVSSKAKRQFQSQTLFQHESSLRLILGSLGISSFPGASASAPDMNEFLTSQ